MRVRRLLVLPAVLLSVALLTLPSTALDQSTTASPASSRRILFDEAHSEWTSIEGNYADFADALRTRGFVVDRITEGPITPALLASYDVYAIGTAWDDFTADEIDAIVQFVEDGGGLFLTGVGWSWVAYQGPIDTYPMNILGANFDIKFLDDTIVDTTNHHPAGGPGNPVLRTAGTHPVTSGVTAISDSASVPCPLQALTAGPQVVVSGDEDAYTPGGSYPAGSHPPLALVASHGLGRVVAVGHEGYFTNTSLQDYDNQQFGLNVVEWLAKVSENVELVGYYDTPGWDRGVAVVGDYAYVCDCDLRILSLADPANPYEAGYYDVPDPGCAMDVAVVGNYAYVAGAKAGLRVVSVVDPEHPTEVGFYDTPGEAWDVAVIGKYAYIADREGGFRVISIADPINPTEVGHYATPAHALDLDVVGDYAYVAAFSSGLRVISVADPTDPTEVGYYNTSGYAYGVDVAGGYAYVVNEFYGLSVIAVSDPTRPAQISHLALPSNWRGNVAVANDYAYVADGSSGLRVVDISTPDAPQEVGYYETTGHAVRLAVVGRTIYLVATPEGGAGGFFILRHVRAESLPQPILLVHGIQAFSPPGSTCRDQPTDWNDGPDYFDWGEMPYWFEQAGYDVWLAYLQTSPLYTPLIEENAQCLQDQINYVWEATGQKAILVAHSMGGLVSRACLNLDDDEFGCRNSTKALYTLGSPNAGINTLFLLKLVAHFKAPLAKDLICQWQPALCECSTDGILWFNLLHPNLNDVNYNFLGGRKTPLPLGWMLWPFDGFNDGLIGSYSAVGWLYPAKLNVIPGPEADRFWTDETHAGSVGHPSYFEASDGLESQAFRCIDSLLKNRDPNSADCKNQTERIVTGAEPRAVLSASTVDIIGHLGISQSVSHTLQVDTGDHSLFYLSWLTGTLSFTLTQPNGQVITPAYAQAHPDVVTYTTSLGGDVMPPFAAYAFTVTLPGLYTMTVGADGVGGDGTGYLVFAALETDRTLSVTTSADLYQVGETATFTGILQGPSGGIAGADAQVQLTRMDGVTETLAFTDLGNGMYQAAYVVPDVPGYLQATFTAIGDDDGVAFTRQVDELLAIAPHAAQLAGTYADRPEDTDGDGYNDTLALDVGLTATQVGTYTLSADLVAQGETIAHATHYTVLASGVQTVTLRFDGWDIHRSHLDGPYAVTHAYLVDLGVGGIPAQIADDVWVTAAYRWQDFGFESLYLPLVLKGH